MSLYDILPEGSQVKCWWSEMKGVKEKDGVPTIAGYSSYIVLLREGGAVVVKDCTVIYIIESVYHEDGGLIERVPVFDKYGNEVNFNCNGSLGVEPYFFGK